MRADQPVEAGCGRDPLIAAFLARSGRNRQIMMDTIGLAIAAVLAPDYRGVYANASTRSADC